MNNVVTNHLPGQVTWVKVFNPKENPASPGKPRPAVLIRREGGHWLVMGLTTNGFYANGRPRVRVPDPEAVGLSAPGWLWGDRLTRVSALDIGDHIGWADQALVATIVGAASLPDDDAASLRSAARPSPQPRQGH